MFATGGEGTGHLPRPTERNSPLVAQFSAEKLRAIRKARMSMNALAEQSGRGRQTVIRAEMGRCIPTLPVLADFAEALGVTVSAFFTEDNTGGDR